MRIEQILKSYNDVKTKIKLLEIEIDDSISLGSKNLDDPLPGRVSARSNTSVVEKQAKNITDIQAQIRTYKRFVSKVDEMLRSLPKDQEKLIREIYEHEIPIHDLSLRYNVVISTIYKRKDVVLKKLEMFSNYFRI